MTTWYGSNGTTPRTICSSRPAMTTPGPIRSSSSCRATTWRSELLQRHAAGRTAGSRCRRRRPGRVPAATGMQGRDSRRPGHGRQPADDWLLHPRRRNGPDRPVPDVRCLPRSGRGRYALPGLPRRHDAAPSKFPFGRRPAGKGGAAKRLGAARLRVRGGAQWIGWPPKHTRRCGGRLCSRKRVRRGGGGLPFGTGGTGGVPETGTALPGVVVASGARPGVGRFPGLARRSRRGTCVPTERTRYGLRARVGCAQGPQGRSALPCGLSCPTAPRVLPERPPAAGLLHSDERRPFSHSSLRTFSFTARRAEYVPRNRISGSPPAIAGCQNTCGGTVSLR